jgi:DNA mismatch repair protein MutL
MIEGEGDRLTDPQPAGAPPGTTVTVRNVFFNTPARRKFLRTEQTETTRVTEAVEALALSHPHIGFKFQSNGRVAIDLSPEQAHRHRIVEVIGPELDDQLLEVSHVDRALTIWGLAGRPDIARHSSRHMRIHLNGRPINDRSIIHAIKEAYRGLIEPSRYPTVVLFLQMDPSQVDVNVHPAKTEVRFRNQAQVHGAALTAVRSALRQADLTPAFQFGAPMPNVELKPEMATAPFGAGLPASPASTSAPDSARTFVDYFRRLDPVQKGFVYSEMKQALASELPNLMERESPLAVSRPEESESAELPQLRAATDVLQVHSSYIVTQDSEGLLIIDQHALHERVMFERLREQIGKGDLESQRLLIPAVVEADRSQVELLGDLQPLLRRIGIEAEPFGPTTIAVHAFSSFLFERGVEPQPFLTELLLKAMDNGLRDDSEAALHETLDMMACKAAVKAGDRLTTQELTDLLKQREIVERSSNCPHGRPTTLRLSLRELARQFGRT